MPASYEVRKRAMKLRHQIDAFVSDLMHQVADGAVFLPAQFFVELRVSEREGDGPSWKERVRWHARAEVDDG